jgi:hypothetical protein
MEVDLESEQLLRDGRPRSQDSHFTMNLHKESYGPSASVAPPTPVLEAFFSSFLPLRSIIIQYMAMDTSPYITTSLATGFITMAVRYIIKAVWAQVEAFFMCVANVPVNNKTYNMVMV